MPLDGTFVRTNIYKLYLLHSHARNIIEAIFSTYELYFHHQICNNNHFWTRHFINYRDNKSLKNLQIWRYGKDMVVEKEGFGAFKNYNINMLLF